MSGWKELLAQVSSTGNKYIIDIIKRILVQKFPHVREELQKSGFDADYPLSFQNEPVKKLEEDERENELDTDKGYEEDEFGIDITLPESEYGEDEIDIDIDSLYQYQSTTKVEEDTLSIDSGFSGCDEDELDVDLSSLLQNENAGDEFSLLYMTAFYGILELVDVLLAAGADPNAPDNNGSTYLHRAVKNGHREVVRILLDKGANVNAADIYGNIPLHYAAQHGDEGIIKILSAKGADNTLENIKGETPISLAKDDEAKKFLKDAENKIKDEKIGPIKENTFESTSLTNVQLFKIQTDSKTH